MQLIDIDEDSFSYDVLIDIVQDFINRNIDRQHNYHIYLCPNLYHKLKLEKFSKVDYYSVTNVTEFYPYVCKMHATLPTNPVLSRVAIIVSHKLNQQIHIGNHASYIRLIDELEFYSAVKKEILDREEEG